MREAELRLDLGTVLPELRHRRVEVVDAMQHDRRLALEVLCHEQPGSTLGEPHLGDPGPEGFDREHHLAPEHVAVVAEVAGDVGARHVEEVEGLDPGHVR